MYMCVCTGYEPQQYLQSTNKKIINEIIFLTDILDWESLYMFFYDLITLMQIKISYKYKIDKAVFREHSQVKAWIHNICLYSANAVIGYAFQQK